MSQSLVVFDLDHTLFLRNASVAFGAYLYRQREFSFVKMVWLLSLYTLHKSRLMSLQTLHDTIFLNLFYGRSFAKISANVDKFLNEQMADLLDKTIYEILQNSLKEQTALLSSSPNFLVEAIAKRLQIPFWMGSSYQTDDNGQFSNLSHVVNGFDKAMKVQELAEKQNISKENIMAYSDSFLDIPLLKAVGCPIAVNPDNKLLKECKYQNWKILWTK